MSKRLVLRVSLVLAATFAFSLFVAVIPASAATTCTSGLPEGVDVALSKTITGTAGTGNPIVNKFTVTLVTGPTLLTAPCDIDVRIEDILENQEITSAGGYSLGNAACDPDAPTASPLVSCVVTFSNLNVNQTNSKTFTITTEATADAGVCDHGVAQIEPPNPLLEPPQELGNNDAGQRCAREVSTTAPGDGGGGFGDDDFGGFGGFGGFGTDFSTVATPIGGVDTGAGGTAGSNAAVPQVTLGSLLAIGFMLLGLRRFRRA